MQQIYFNCEKYSPIINDENHQTTLLFIPIGENEITNFIDTY